MEGKNYNLRFKFLIPLFLIISYWFYLSICLGYFLSKIFSDYFKGIDKSNLSKKFNLKKKLNFKNLIKIIINFFWKLLINLMIIFFEKFFLLKKAINKLIIALKIFFKKLKSPLKIKRNLRLLRALLGIFWETYLVGISLWNKIFFLDNIRK